MTCRWREPLILGAALGWGRAAPAQQVKELGLQVTGAFSHPAVGAAGVYGALRTSGRTRFSLSLVAGGSDAGAIVRGELLGHFLLSPEERRKPGFYLAGGIAGIEGVVSRGYLVLTAGLEQRPRGRSGWAIEAGVGGGVRLALGYRWRWFSGPESQ
jgi:hypothetical protein